ncbi:MAG: hypothetical protein FD167_5865, partial [bacterium]
MSSINNNFSNAAQSFDQATSLAKDALSLATAINGGNLKDTLDSAGKVFENLGNLNSIIGGSTSSTNVAQGTAMSSQAIAKLFGVGIEAENDKQKENAKNAAAGGNGAPRSLGDLLALISNAVVNAVNTTMDKLADAAKALDAKASAGNGSTAEDTQLIQRLTFNLQQEFEALKTMTQTISNASKTQSETLSSVAQNVK